MKNGKFYFTLMFLVCFFTGFAQVPFTPGNIVVSRIGNGAANINTALTQTVYLDEYTPAGTLVQTIAMPTAASGSNNILTLVGGGGGGSNRYTGNITLSADRRFITLAGYNAAPGTGLLDGVGVSRTIGLVKYDGTVNTTTSLTDFSQNGTPTAAITTNGIDLWCGGYQGTTAATGGIHYTTIGSTTSTQLNTDAYSNIFGLQISNGQLYGVTPAQQPTGFFPSVSTVGTGIPTTAGQTLTNLPGLDGSILSSPEQFVFADLDPTVPGVDVVYVSDNDYGGIVKLSLVGGTWTFNDISSVGGSGLTGYISGTAVTLFGITNGSNASQVGGGSLFSLVDNGGYNAPFSSTTGTIIATTPTDKASFRGVAFVPQAPVIKVAIKTFLQGAYSTGLNRHKDVTTTWAGVLNAHALSQPYNTASFGNYAGTESVSAGFFTSTGATTDIVDWVLLELRDATTPTTVIARRAAFIREDGRIVDLDGTSDVSFSGVATGNYYVVVRHRNHLPIRSSSAIALSSTATLYDFSAQQSNAYQDGAVTTNAAMKDVSGNNTVFAMWGGNANSNTKVSFTGVNNDAGSILGALGGNQGTTLSSVYNIADLNLDGSVKYTGTNNDSGLLLSVLGSNQTVVYTQHQ
jgi:hypothetical protein